MIGTGGPNLGAERLHEGKVEYINGVPHLLAIVERIKNYPQSSRLVAINLLDTPEIYQHLDEVIAEKQRLVQLEQQFPEEPEVSLPYADKEEYWPDGPILNGRNELMAWQEDGESYALLPLLGSWCNLVTHSGSYLVDRSKAPFKRLKLSLRAGREGRRYCSVGGVEYLLNPHMMRNGPRPATYWYSLEGVPIKDLTLIFPAVNSKKLSLVETVQLQREMFGVEV